MHRPSTKPVNIPVDDLVTRDYLQASLEAMERRLTAAMYSALLIQAAVVVGGVFALLRLIP